MVGTGDWGLGTGVAGGGDLSEKEESQCHHEFHSITLALYLVLVVVFYVLL